MADKPWVANGPEDRLSIAVNRFLHDTLVPPFWCSAIHDQDGGKRSMLQRTRDVNRGIKKGQLDWDVVQGPAYLHRKLELKRGKNNLTEAQWGTINALDDCGGPPIVAWDLKTVWAQLASTGYRFLPNVLTRLRYYEELLAAWDREAELVLSGVVVKKRSTKPPAARASPAKVRATERVRARVMC